MLLLFLIQRLSATIFSVSQRHVRSLSPEPLLRLCTALKTHTSTQRPPEVSPPVSCHPPAHMSSFDSILKGWARCFLQLCLLSDSPDIDRNEMGFWEHLIAQRNYWGAWVTTKMQHIYEEIRQDILWMYCAVTGGEAVGNGYNKEASHTRVSKVDD